MPQLSFIRLIICLFSLKQYILIMNQRGNNDWHFIKTNHRPPKPRAIGLTEIRGPYYTTMGKRYIQDV
ncbi:MAG: hypothetical protein ICV81_16015 [Flavisolibacter sp.]|nr:hypothetical protein [Flavisolibacter sp.]